ncbi:MAG: exodeoxyribonuclease V subunit gamma [Alcaligenaceae bacterium]|nr:exodeoxyribonuclease V subunit gamma [Alcaligenaceae bacterium]
MNTELTPGLMLVHGNRAEQLREVLCAWVQRYPLAPLENETLLVHSNGIAQWLRLSLAGSAQDAGIAAALDFSLPSRFLWRVYRAVLGADAVPQESPLDKPRLVWRLMRLLPELLDQPEYEVLRQFLVRDDDSRKRFQLAGRLADLLDQYQVYRADWLAAWLRGEDVWIDGRGQVQALPGDQVWQAALWRALVGDVAPDGGTGLTGRAFVHDAFMNHMSQQQAQARPAGVPRRILVFGISSLPGQAVEALAALSCWTQVLMCVHNPCAHYWADIVPDKDMLRAGNCRQARRPGLPMDLSEDQMHQHAHPLLASWGKQGRDFISLLDQIDDADARTRYGPAFEAMQQRIDVFEPLAGATLLEQLQDDIRDLRPVRESRQNWSDIVPGDEVSIRFHIAHSAQREVEILHDQLLEAFSADPSLRPRDVIVMVPDIEAYAPHVQAVFGLHDSDDRRAIPYALADRGQRKADPLVLALEMLLGIGQMRLTMGDVLGLLEAPALRARFGISDEDMPRLHDWIRGANVRWGLHAEHRASLGLAPTDALGMGHTWLFGLRRMLLGFAAGLDAEPWQGIEPYGEPGGMDAVLLGPLARLVDTLDHYWRLLADPATPAQWHTRLLDLAGDFFLAETEQDAFTIMRFGQVLQDWHEACDQAGLIEDLPLGIVAEHCMAQFEPGGLTQRFFAGAVTFATLMPMRAIPFRRVCLLGMHDGAYPRTQVSADFDLMVGRYRPGDRSRREDDRYLFLEALLSARDQFYVSWVGRSIQDNSEQPPSVLVAQLRDHLDAGRRVAGAPDAGLAQALTVEHPLQPFSSRYFPLQPDASGAGLFTYAREWREAASGGSQAADSALALIAREEPLTLSDLQRFLRQPVQAFFTARLGVVFDLQDRRSEDLEPYEPDGLGLWSLRDQALHRMIRTEDVGADGAASIDHTLARMQGRGDLAGGNLGVLLGRDVREGLDSLLDHYREVCRLWPDPEDSATRIHLTEDLGDGRSLMLVDQLNDIRRNADGRRVRVVTQAQHLVKGKTYRPHALIAAWLGHLAGNLDDGTLSSVVLSPQGSVMFEPLAADQAAAALADILRAWDEGMRAPLPVACLTAFTWLRTGDLDKAQTAYAGEVETSPYLHRAYPDFQALTADGRFADWAARLYQGPADAIRPMKAFLDAHSGKGAS